MIEDGTIVVIFLKRNKRILNDRRRNNCCNFFSHIIFIGKNKDKK